MFLRIQDLKLLLPEFLTANGRTYSFDKKGIDALAGDVNNIRTQKAQTILRDARVNEGRNDVARPLDVKASNDIEVDEFDVFTHRASLPDELLDVESILTNAILQKESQFEDAIIQSGRQVVSEE